MTTASTTLSEFALALQYDQIPPAVLERARACMIDTVAAITFGAELPWSKIIIAHAQRNSAPGKGAVIGTGLKVRAPFAALCNGAMAHAFELDSLCQPSVGVHPGASLTAPVLAVAHGNGNTGREVLEAFVAGFEVMYRIGDAARHTSEKLGFHAPGLTGVFGGAIAAGKLMKLDAERMTNALGIGGSLCSGLLEFSKSGGGMVKRLHLGRAAESGVLAAILARDGFTGPHTVLDGKFGFLNVYARDTDPPRLLQRLGEEWHTLKTMHKRYACHITAHVPVTAALQLKAEHNIAGKDVASVTVAGSEKMMSHHNITEPQDLMMAQYSTPFCVALALHGDPVDPRAFSEAALNDAGIRAVCRNTTLTVFPEKEARNAFSTRLTVKLKNGREFTQELHEFEGMPGKPLSAEGLATKFRMLTAGNAHLPAEQVLSRLLAIEKEDVDGVRALFD